MQRGRRSRSLHVFPGGREAPKGVALLDDQGLVLKL